MSAVKRKGGPSAKGTKENPAKRKKFDTPEKKNAKSPRQNGTKALASAKESILTNPQTTKTSILSSLKDDEPMFPRGGGNILTPLEQKKIQMQAKEDALQEDELETSKPKGKKKERSRKREKKTTDEKFDPDAVKVESLNFKASPLNRQKVQYIH